MPIRSIRRTSAMAALALGLLMVTALPASASATGFVLEASSAIDITPSGGSFLDEHLTGHATSNVCAPNSTSPTAIPVSFDSSGGGAVGPATTDWTDLIIGTNSLKRRLVIDSGSMTLSATGVSVALQVRFEYRTCSSLTALCTTNSVSITLTGPSIGHHPTASTRVAVSGVSSHISTPFTCNAVIRAAINSQTAAFNLNLHFT